MSEKTPDYIANAKVPTQEELLDINRELKPQVEVLGYQVEALQDMTRINVSAGILGALAAKSGKINDKMLEDAYEYADRLVTFQVDQIEKKSFAFQEKMNREKEQMQLEKLGKALNQAAKDGMGGEN